MDDGDGGRGDGSGDDHCVQQPVDERSWSRVPSTTS